MKEKTIFISLILFLIILSACSKQGTISSQPNDNQNMPSNQEKSEIINSCKQLITFQEVSNTCGNLIPSVTNDPVSGFVDIHQAQNPRDSFIDPPDVACEIYAVPPDEEDYDVLIIESVIGSYDIMHEKDRKFSNFTDLTDIGNRAYQFMSNTRDMGFENDAFLRILIFEDKDGVVWELNSKPWEIEPIVGTDWSKRTSCNFEELQNLARKIQSRVLQIPR